MAAAVTKVIGVGNPLMGDDGVGITAIELLQKGKLPTEVELIDGGCGGLVLLQLLEDCPRALIIDAADFAAEPGNIRILRNPDLSQLSQNQQLQLIHQPGLLEIFILADKLQRLPLLTLVLVQVESCEPKLQLSTKVEAALPELVRTVLNEITDPSVFS